MVTMAQRIEELRTERGLNRPQLAAALGFPKNAPEKFETGRTTPTKEQQERMADFFGVSLFYLRGESNDRTRLEAWLDGSFSDSEPGYVPMPAAPKKAASPALSPTPGGQGTLLDSFLNSKQFQEMVHSAILDVLRSPEGADLLAKAVKRELMKQR